MVYYPTAGAGFVTDTLGWFESYNKYGWSGISFAFGDHSLHYVYHALGFLLYKTFGWHGYGWYAVFTALHACAASLGYAILCRVLKGALIPYATGISFISCLLFLLSPYQTEPLVWYACSHYLLATALLLLAFRSFLNYLQTNALQHLLLYYIFFVVSVFTLEISFCFPLFLMGFILLAPNQIIGNLKRIRLSMQFAAPALATVAAYFLLSKLLKGSAAGHYGAAVHFNLSPALLVGNFSKHILKLLGLSQFYTHSFRMKFYTFFETNTWLFFFLSVVLITVAVILWRYRRLSNSTRIALILFIGFVMALAPVVNLYFTSIIRVEGDRFNYLPSFFFYAALCVVCFTLFRKAAYPLLAIFLLANVYCLLKNIQAWHNNREVAQSLLKSFKWENASHVYILNLPDNFEGTYMFRSFPPDNSFAETIDLQNGTQLEQKSDLLLQYNMNSVADSFTVEKISETDLQIKFAQYGEWWWINGIGAGSYKTQNVDVTIDEWGTATYHFKNKIPGAVYIYQCGKQWKTVEF